MRNLAGALLCGLAASSALSSGSFGGSGWHVEAGMNACGTACGTRRDQPGLHFVGLFPNASVCAATCERVPARNCSIWLHSSGSGACWWRTDGVWRVTAQADVTSACREAAGADGTPCVPGCGACPAARTPSPTPAPPVISGRGKFRYQYDPSRLQLPPSVQLLNGHGLARDAAGRIYFTYESSNKGDAGVRALIRYRADGTGGELLGNATLAQGVPHGLKVQREADGAEYLYHANNAATVTKTTLGGAIVWRTDMTSAWQHDAANWPFKPTDLLLAPGAPDTLLVADGYGLSRVHAFDRATGRYTGVVFGGKGDAAAPGEPATFQCNHGLSLDDRVGEIVVSDRSNHRLVWIRNDGTLLRTQNVAASAPLPCNAQTSNGTALGAEYLLVPGLGLDYVDPGPWRNGSVAIFNGANKLVSNIEVAALLGVGVLGHTHPHDAIFLQNGDIAVAVWKGHEAGSVGGLEYWRRLPE
eukprot:g1365.t1